MSDFIRTQAGVVLCAIRALRDSKLSRNRTDITAITEDAKERPNASQSTLS